MGVHLDAGRNRGNETVITREGATPRAMVVPTNEELMIARETVRVLFS
jgi:acetate kinase